MFCFACFVLFLKSQDLFSPAPHKSQIAFLSKFNLVRLLILHKEKNACDRFGKVLLSKKKVINFYIPGWCLLGAGSLLGAKYPGRSRIEASEQTFSSVTLYSNSALSLLEGK